MLGSGRIKCRHVVLVESMLNSTRIVETRHGSRLQLSEAIQLILVKLMEAVWTKFHFESIDYVSVRICGAKLMGRDD